MPRYQVYYWKSPMFCVKPEDVNRTGLEFTHTDVGEIVRDYPDDVFRDMQGEFMTASEALRVGKLAGHTSMSVGDALLILEGDDEGLLLVCDWTGWIHIPPN